MEAAAPRIKPGDKIPPNGRQRRYAVPTPLTPATMPTPPARPAPAAIPQALDALDAQGRSLIRHALWLDALNAQWRPHLPPRLRGGQVRIGSVRGKRLQLLASHASWASRARLESAELLKIARTHLGLEVQYLDVRISPPAPLPPPPRHTPPSPVARAALRDIRALLEK